MASLSTVTGQRREIMSVYQEMGYESRRDYLTSLADEYGIDPVIVFTLASMLGPSEDFDGLVTSLEDEYA